MAGTISVPRDERFGELGHGLGTLLGGMMRDRRRKQQEEENQRVFLDMASASTKEDYLRAAAPLARTPQMSLQVMKRADEKFAKSVQEYKVTLRSADGTLIEDVPWYAEEGLTTLDLKDVVNSAAQPQGMEFAFGTPETAPAQVEPVTGRVTSPGPISAGEFANIESGKRQRAERLAGPGKASKEDVAAQDYLTQQGFQVNKRNMTRARTVQRDLPKVTRNLRDVFTEAFGKDWASFGGNQQKFEQALQMAESMLFMGANVSNATALAAAAARQGTGQQISPEEQGQVDKALEDVQGRTRDIQEDMGTVRGFFSNLLGGRQQQTQPGGQAFRGKGAAPETAAEPAEPQAVTLTPLGTRDGELVFIPDSIRTATEAVNYLVSQGWSWEDARQFVLEQEQENK